MVKIRRLFAHTSWIDSNTLTAESASFSGSEFLRETIFSPDAGSGSV